MLVATDKDLPERIFLCGTFETCRYVTSYFFMHTFLFTFVFRYFSHIRVKPTKYILRRPGQSQGLLYKHHCNEVINSFTD